MSELRRQSIENFFIIITKESLALHWWPFAIPDMLFHSSIYETTDRITIAKCLVRKPLGSIEMIFQEGNESKFLVHRKFTCVWSNSLLSGWWRRIPATAVAYETLSWSRNPRKSGYFWLSIVKGTQGNRECLLYTCCPLVSFFAAYSNHSRQCRNCSRSNNLLA